MSSVTALNDPERDRPHRDRRGLAAPVKAPVKAPAIPSGELVYGLVVAVDIESFSRLDTLDQSLAQERLRDVLDVAAQKSGLDRDDEEFAQLAKPGEEHSGGHAVASHTAAKAALRSEMLWWRFGRWITTVFTSTATINMLPVIRISRVSAAS